MASSMSPPPARPGQSPYPPPFPPNSASPANAAPYGHPPAKRQRLSPDPRSPHVNGTASYASPSQPHAGGPVTSAYGNPYAPQTAQTAQSPQTYASSPQSSFHAPQPYPYQDMPWQSQSGTPTSAHMAQTSTPSHPSREMMPPPPRPNRDDRDEKAGVEEIGDSLYGSGINLKDEENYMHSVYNNRHTGENLTNNSNTSFGSTTASTNNSFNILTQSTSFGSQDTKGAFTGTIGQPQSADEIVMEDRRKRDAASRARGERMQHHLNNQFLLCNNVRKRLDDIAKSHGVSLNTAGLLVKQPDPTVTLNGAGSQGMATVKDRAGGISTVSQGAPFEQMLALLSLAAGERVRGLVDESFSLARARRYGDHGRVVPPEFADIAEGEGNQHDEDVVPRNVTGSQWDRVLDGSPDGVQAQVSSSTTPQPQHTISFDGSLNLRLREIAERDRRAEKDRIRKREARKRAAEAAANGEVAGTDAGGEAALAGLPADAAAPVKLSKKEQAKQQKEKSSLEAQTNSAVNQTAAMMSLGRKGNKYSWMSGGAANLPTNRFAKPGSGAATPAVKQEARSPATGAVATASGASGVVSEPQWGDWREDGIDGKGVQLRDWVLVLERDGREKMALHQALLKLT